MTQAAAPVEIGQVLAGKYRVDRVLGAGGMGVVVAATHVQLDQRVAIKFLLPEAMASAEVVERFAREARAAVKIQSEHVARVIDVGTLENNAPYIVMEYLEGTDLARRIAGEGRLSVEEAARCVLQACEAIAEAHAAGIVHRDIKPANLFLARRADKTSMVKVLDFGISKSTLGGGAGGITSTQAVMGSPYYMSPEQLMSAKHVDHRSDIWSLGIVLYEALVGSPPYVADTMPEIVARILQAPPPRVSELRPEVPASVDAILARCLAKDPKDRFRDVAELAKALAPLSPEGPRSNERIARVLGASLAPDAPPAGAVGGSASVTAVMSSRLTPQPAAKAATTSPEWSQTHASAGLPKKSGAMVWILAGAAGLAGVGALVFFATRHHGDEGSSQPHGIVTPVEATSMASTVAGLIPAPPAAITADPPAETKSAASTAPTMTPAATHVGGKPIAKASATSTAKPTASVAVTAPPPPPPQPTPTQTSQSSLHMGIK